jgi:glyoxylase-like metal-dependent hydrolase (beta-lactamase superfamily II)
MPIRAVIAPVTPLQQNCTIVWCAKTMKAAVIDPGGEVDAPDEGHRRQGPDPGERSGSPTATWTTPAARPS